MLGSRFRLAHGAQAVFCRGRGVVSGNQLTRTLAAQTPKVDVAEKTLARFTDHFAKAFGPDRAQALVDALRRDSIPGALLNTTYADDSAVQRYVESNKHAAVFEHVSPLKFLISTDGTPLTPSPLDQSKGRAVAYHMDAASLLPVLALDLFPGAKVLDCCAAPGGKSLAIAQLLSSRGYLQANDLSRARIKRLGQVLLSYLLGRGGNVVPPLEAHVFPSRIDFVSNNGLNGFGTNHGAFDRVLLDAPCSGERHVLADQTDLLSWSPRRIKTNAGRQKVLLRNALKMCKPGGVVVYSTCALSPEENDDVVRDVLGLPPPQQPPQPASKHMADGGTVPAGPAPRPAVRRAKLAKLAQANQTAASDDSGAAPANARAGQEQPVATVVPLSFPFGEPTALGGWIVLPDQPVPGLHAPPSSDSVATSGQAGSSAGPASGLAGRGLGPLYICKLVTGQDSS